MSGRILLEVCVDEPAGLEAAVRGGADRIELCSALALGGLTPSPGLIRFAAGTPVPVHVMIRPRPGGFLADPQTLAAMHGDIDAVRAAGLAGVVLGVSLPDRRLDQIALRGLLEHAGGLGTTLHRVFDLVPDPFSALEEAVELGFDQVLTSGGAASAPGGAAVLRRLAHAAGGRIAVMAGGGLRPDLVEDLVLGTGVRQVHASCSEAATPEPRAVALGFAAAEPRTTSEKLVRAMRRALDAIAA